MLTTKILRSSVIATGILLTLILSYLQFDPVARESSIFQRIEYILYDNRFNISLKFQPPFENNNQIVIVDIDEASLLEQGRMPWGRDKMAKMIQKLVDAGALVVSFDILFSEPQLNPTQILQQVLLENQQPELAKEIGSYQIFTDYDQQLADTMLDIDVVLSLLFSQDASIQVGELPPALQVDQNLDIDRLTLRTAYGYTSNLSMLMQSAIQAGFFVPAVDADGIIRSVPLIQEFNQKLYPSLALATGLAYFMVEDVQLNVARLNQEVDVIQGIRLLENYIPTGAIGDVLVPYAGPKKTFPYVSATNLLEGRADRDLLENAIVFVGTSAVGLADLRSTPVGTEYPGVEVHANLLNGLIDGRFPYTPDLAPKLISVVILLLGLVLSVYLTHVGPLTIILSALGLLASYLFVNFYFWHVYLINLPLTMPLLLIIALAVMHLMSGFLIEGWSKREISDMFGQYVPKAHIDKMLNAQNAFSFEGENKQLTVLFSDIRSFTAISEKLSATDLKGMLNSFFTPITEIIFHHQGTIDKYVGDMVMAFWGAPIDDAEHAQNALLAALKILKKVDELKPIFKEKGYPEIEVGIGVNSGPMNVGDMGSSFRRSYTVLGDAVNLGSRLESLTKFYGVRLLVGPQTHAACQGVVFRFIDKIIVKGKDEPVMVYEPLALEKDVFPSQLEELQSYELAYQYYLKKQWAKSKIAFLQLVKISANEQLYQVYLARIEVLRNQSIPDHWDGTYRHTEK